jgi:hypothetical protein
MARPKYKITSSDVQYVQKYLLSALANADYFVVDKGNFIHYLKTLDFSNCKDEYDLELQATIMNRWCESVLSSDQWGRLKTSIRKMRYLDQEKNTLISVDLKPEAHAILQKIVANGQADSLSDAILWLSNK